MRAEDMFDTSDSYPDPKDEGNENEEQPEDDEEEETNELGIPILR